MRQGFRLAAIDLGLVPLLLAAYGSSRFAWLGGPISALAIWCVDSSARDSRLVVRLGKLARPLERDALALLDRERVRHPVDGESGQLVDRAQRQRAGEPDGVAVRG